MELKPKVSIICAAARSHERTQLIHDTWKELNPECEMEFVFPSPFTIPGAICFKDDMSGCSHANAQGYQYCTGDYVAWLSDETMPTKGCLKRMVDFVDANSVDRPFLAEFIIDMIEEPNERYIKNFFVCGLQYARFGMATKKTLDMIGGFFDIRFHAHWVDSDLALRCWDKGGHVKACFDSVIECISFTDALYEGNRDKYFHKDYLYFLSKWRSKFPLMQNPNWRNWNTHKDMCLKGGRP